MKFIKPFFFVLVLAGLVIYWSQTGNVSEQNDNDNTPDFATTGAASSSVAEGNMPPQTLGIPAKTTSTPTDFSEQTSIIEQSKTITLLAEQSLTVWPQGCNLVVLEKNNRRHVNDGETLILEATSADKRIIHLVEKGHFKYNKNTTRFSKKEKAASVTEQELEARLSGVKKTGSSSCSSRYQINQA